MTQILVDVDDVLSDFTGACLNLAAQMFNIFARPEDCTRNPIGDAIGCPTLDNVIDEEILRGEFCYRMKPIDGAIEFLRELESTFGVENVDICTAPWFGDRRERATGEWASQRYSWLRDYAGIPRSRVFMCAKKSRVSGILIDDSVKNLVNRDFGYCIAQPYNTEYKGPRGNYRECLEWLKEIVK